MFGDFDKTFFPDTETIKKVPKEIISSLNRGLPQGIVYRDIGGGFLGIDFNADEIKFEGFSFLIPDEAIERFKLDTMPKVEEYIYRTQRKIRLKLEKNGYLIANGEYIKTSDFFRNPITENMLKETELFIYPLEFTEFFKVKLDDHDIKEIITLKRQPYDSMSKKLFQNIDDKGFNLSCIVDEETCDVKLKFSYNLNNINDISGMIEILKIHHACINGNAEINGLALSASTNGEVEMKALESKIEFWEKVLVLQSHLNVLFDFRREVTNKEISIIEELYSFLIKNEGLKRKLKNSILKLTIKRKPKKGVLNSFKITQKEIVNILGVELKTHVVIGFIDLHTDSVTQINDKPANYEVISSKTDKSEEIVFRFLDEDMLHHFFDQGEIAQEILKNKESVIHGN
ncbi:abortive infection system toxin AbiGii family protein [Bacillus sp. Wb]